MYPLSLQYRWFRNLLYVSAAIGVLIESQSAIEKQSTPSIRIMHQEARVGLKHTKFYRHPPGGFRCETAVSCRSRFTVDLKSHLRSLGWFGYVYCIRFAGGGTYDEAMGVVYETRKKRTINRRRSIQGRFLFMPCRRWWEVGNVCNFFFRQVLFRGSTGRWCWSRRRHRSTEQRWALSVQWICPLLA